MNYSAKVLHYFTQTPHAGSLAGSENVGVGEAGSSSTPDLIRFFVHIENDCIKIVRFQANGSVVTIACAEFLAQWCEHKPLSELKNLNPEFIMESLEIPALKIHSARLAIDALKNALKEER